MAVLKFAWHRAGYRTAVPLAMVRVHESGKKVNEIRVMFVMYSCECSIA